MLSPFSIDLRALLQTPGISSQEMEANSFETSQQQSFGQALVFTNSQHNSQLSVGGGIANAVNSYSAQSLVKFLLFQIISHASQFLCAECLRSPLATLKHQLVLKYKGA